jgi:hypothetical protein
MLNEIAQSSKFRIFSCISTLFLYLGVAIGDIYSYIYQGQREFLASEPRTFPKVSLAEFSAQTLPLIGASVVALILLFYRPTPSKRKRGLNPREFRSFGKNTSFEILFVIDI